MIYIQLHKLAFKIIHSTMKLLPVWHKIVVEQKLADWLMPGDVAMRWNSTYDMLEFALEYQKVLGIISSDRSMELREFELLNRDACQQCLVLAQQILKHATLFFSHSTPNLATVIPTMDIIDKTLATNSLDMLKYDTSICASVSLAKKMLNRYYNMTD
ncbi:hypothetical protein JAAARDRAFT_142893 [Jaapia argillacea MUCL 33604]|uniref:Uncharacterized protein n=1 Tax=Jaapia argillacea MUCL 33604 TaxID=933084 RepID=A0A067PH81_9AGAM|nr:hypothetical protein JAAARDRAFT_142893 [Jaapia argillacea MUCL 33604]